MFFPINRWNLTGKIVSRAVSFETATEAEASGRQAEETYKDQKFERVFEGTWAEFDILRKS